MVGLPAGDDAEAVVTLEAAQKAVVLDSDDAWAHLALGFVYGITRRAGEAVVEHEKALALNPNFAIAYTYQGAALAYLGRGEEALLKIDASERLSPRGLFQGVNSVCRCCPLAARARQGENVRRIGALLNFAENDREAESRLAALRHGLERHGWSEGRNVHLDCRFAAVSAERTEMLAKELVALHPDVILAHSTAVAVALQRETRVIPIVFVNVSDPMGYGLIASLARLNEAARVHQPARRRGGVAAGALFRAGGYLHLA